MKPPIRKQIKTREDWCPTVGGKVKVFLSELSDGVWRVSVCGDDDFGLERDYPHDQRGAAEDLFNKIKDYTTQNKMRSLGMYGA